MTGDDWKGKAIPIGAKVFFSPTDTRDKTHDHKFDPKGIAGIFAGYVVTTGRSWSRKYRVWDMKELANVNLSMDAASPTEACSALPDRGDTFFQNRSRFLSKPSMKE